MTIDVRTEVAIDAPRERVAGYAADPGNAPAWFSHIHAAESDAVPVRAGSTFTFVARMAGRPVRVPYDVVEHASEERMVFRTDRGPMPMETTYTWRDGDAGQTVMALHNRGRLRGPAKLVAPLMRRAMRRSNLEDLTRLKSILEAAEEESQ